MTFLCLLFLQCFNKRILARFQFKKNETSFEKTYFDLFYDDGEKSSKMLTQHTVITFSFVSMTNIFLPVAITIGKKEK